MIDIPDRMKSSGFLFEKLSLSVSILSCHNCILTFQILLMECPREDRDASKSMLKEPLWGPFNFRGQYLHSGCWRLVKSQSMGSSDHRTSGLHHRLKLLFSAIHRYLEPERTNWDHLVKSLYLTGKEFEEQARLSVFSRVGKLISSRAINHVHEQTCFQSELNNLYSTGLQRTPR